MSVNSNHYGWNDITVLFGGRSLSGLTKIEAEFGYEHEEVRGKGGKAQAINETDFAVSGTLGILQSDFEAIVDQFGIDYQRTYFDVLWNFTGKNDIAPRTHIIKNLKFGKTKMGMSRGDAFMEIELPYKALDIELAK